MLALLVLVPGTQATSAQTACLADREPNDAPEQSAAAVAPLCIEGTLPADDQDLVLWDVSEADALQPWTFRVDGPPRTLTGLRIIPIVSEPGESPVRVGSPLLEVDHGPSDIGPTIAADVLMPPGRFVIGVTRSDTDDGSEVTDPRYRVEVAPGAPLPDPLEQEPNDEPSDASPVEDLFVLGGDLQGSHDHYRWTVTERLAGVPIELRANGPLGAGLSVELQRADGSPLQAMDGFDTDARGAMTLHDLVLPAGEYRLRLTPFTDRPFPYRLEAARSETTDVDPEPNDDTQTAVPLDPTTRRARGRLTEADARDRFVLTVDEGLAGRLLDVRLLWRDRLRRDLCLLDDEGRERQCRYGEAGVVLEGIRLRPGSHVLEVRGDPAAWSRYLLRVDPTSVAPPDFEAEPNDDNDQATPMAITGTMRGRASGIDDDHFEVTVTGEPQLWQLDVTGSGLEHVSWLHRDRTELRRAEVSGDRTSASITDLYLIPGRHWFEVGGADDSEYRFSFTPLGPPDPLAEREPNDDSTHAGALLVDTERSGRLADGADTDVFRFTLDAPDHVRLTLTPPSDGAVRLRLEGGTLRFADVSAREPGTPVVWDGLLQPGDYEAWVVPLVPSQARYWLALERDDPFVARTDLEPNDDRALATAVPATLRVEGTGTPSGDVDWYRLGPLPAGGDLAFRATGPVVRVVVADAERDHTTDRPEPGRFLVAGLLAGEPLWLRVETDAADPYVVDIEPGDTGLPPPAPAPAPLEASVAVVVTPQVVSAYRTVSQAVSGTITIRNTGTDDLALSIDTATSDHRWTATPASDRVGIAAGATLDVPLDIRVGPDVPTGRHVRISVRVRDANGAQVTGATEVATDGTIEPVDPRPGWTIPNALLGGLDVASIALGGSPVDPRDPEREAQLYDWVTPSGSGFRTSFEGEPVLLTVDLAGDAPVPIAGTILNPRAARTSQASVPRAFTLLLSEDGSTWVEALHGELSPLMVDQPFVLPEPIQARFAQLRLESLWGPGSELTLGGWKVIAVPGATPDPMPSNIAEPIRGGHVVWMSPQAGFQEEADAMLVDEPDDRLVMYADAGRRLRWVVGFQDDRAALVDRLEWQDPPGSDPAIRIRRVDVEVSTTGPIGPWTSLGAWRLTRADDGSVPPFELPPGTWARFLRFTSGPPRQGAFQMERPAALRVIEHPTDDAYRSILGEWGDGSPMGPMDLLGPHGLTPVVTEDQDDDTPERARPLPPGTTVRDRAHRNQDVDWYSVTIPDGRQSVSFEVGGDPSVGVALTLVDAAGATVPTSFGPGASPGTVTYRANVTPGETYRVRVEQPPFSAVFTYDTSGSMGPYLSHVLQAMASYTGGVTRGAEQVLVIPFAEPPLLKEWSDDPWLLQGAVAAFRGQEASSDAEVGLFTAAEALEGREGARAVLMVTDAETSSYRENERLWQELEAVRPMVFTVHIGADGTPHESRRFMQDWAMAGNGQYQYATTHGDLDRAFERMATWLRRPATYQLGWTASEDEVPPPPPGRLAVVAPPDEDGTTGAVVGPGVAVEIVLDTSGSMRERFGGERRIDIARRVLASMVRRDLPAGLPVAMRTFVQEPRSCRTELAVPLGPLDPEALATRIEDLRILRSVRTPLARAIRAAADDLEGVTGPRIVIVVSDGAESCGGDPAREVRRLRDRGVDVTVNVVGLALDDRDTRRAIRRLAQLGGGTYFDARDPDEVAQAIRTAVSAPFQVFDQDGRLVGRGTVGGGAIELPPGVYRVVVLTDPEMTYEGVVVEQEGSVTVTLPSAGDRPVEAPRPAPSETPPIDP